MKSECFVGSSVAFPKFTGERVYMREFIPANGLPKELERWQKTVDAMLVGVNAPGSVYCSFIPRDSLKVKRMLPGVVYLGETGSMLHSALELSTNALRTVVRLNVPGWVPN
jgi:hypothetical protein